MACKLLRSQTCENTAPKHIWVMMDTDSGHRRPHKAFARKGQAGQCPVARDQLNAQAGPTAACQQAQSKAVASSTGPHTAGCVDPLAPWLGSQAQVRIRLKVTCQHSLRLSMPTQIATHTLHYDSADTGAPLTSAP